MSEQIVVAQPTAVYLTQAPGSRLYVAGAMGKRDPNARGGFISFAPTGAVQPHPHALQQTYQVEGFAFASDQDLIDELDRLQHMGHVPFIRHPEPELCVSGANGAEPGVGVGP